MGYIGQSVNIPVGQVGLKTDLPTSEIPPTALTKGTNIRFSSGAIEKYPGSTKFNSTALTGSVVGLFDWFPSGTLQRLIAMTADGKLWRDTGSGDFTAGVPIDSTFGSPVKENVKFVPAGLEVSGQNRKLFIFSSTHQLSYLDGDATTVTTSATPAADWSVGNYPRYGFVSGGRLWAFGNPNRPHRIYYSDTTDHANFAGGTSGSLALFPGDNDRLMSGFVYKSRIFLFKAPQGVYFIDDSDPTPANWFVGKLDTSFGAASPHSVVQALDDLIAGNSTGSLTSLKATDAFGDLESGDILSNAEIENYIRDLTNKDGTAEMQALYYPEQKELLFTYRTKGGTFQDLILTADLNKQSPRFSVNNKDAAEVLALRKDSDGIQRPIYGDRNGFVFLMDSNTYDVAGVAYPGEFQTPEIDFTFLDPALGVKNKLFDFITLVFEGRSKDLVHVDVFIDGKLKETLSYPQTTGTVLGEFLLGTDFLTEIGPEDLRKPVHGAGRRIKLRVYNTTGTPFKIESIVIGFRLGDEAATLTGGS